MKGYFNVWVEGTAGRVAQEVASCVKKRVLSECENVEELVLWADHCGGQNRKIKMAVMLKHILQNHPTLKKITLRFPIPGHSFLPNDSWVWWRWVPSQNSPATVYWWWLHKFNEDLQKKKPVCRQKDAKGRVFIVNTKKDLAGEKINGFSFREIEVRKVQPFSGHGIWPWPQRDWLDKKVQNRVCNMVTLLNSHLTLLWP